MGIYYKSASCPGQLLRIKKNRALIAFFGDWCPILVNRKKLGQKARFGYAAEKYEVKALIAV